jgi:2-methylisocitrate lyase-like PEP mutase family enzyme
MSHPGKAFRNLHQQEGAFIIPNPWDVGSARLLALLGFKALATTSSGMAFALGLADGAVSPELVLKHCRDLAAATALPVSADLENGFGHSPESVAETIIAAAETGLAGCSIEDHTGDPEDPIYDFDLAVERIHAASEACAELDHDFVLTARCENLLWGRPDLDDVISRLQAFESAGADVLFAPGLHTLEAIRQVCSAISSPVSVVAEIPGKPFSVAELAGAGVKRISVGALLARLAYGSLISAGREMLDTNSFAFAETAIDFDTLDTLFRQTN